MTRRRSLVLMLAAGTIACGVPEAADSGAGAASTAQLAPSFECAEDNAGITLPEGFCAVAFADELGTVRHLAVADNGDVYASSQPRRRRDEAGEIVIDSPGGVIALRDADGDGVAEIRETVNDVPGTGVALYEGHLYYTSTTEIWRVARRAGELVPGGSPELMVSGFPQQGQHASKPIAFDNAGGLYVTVGAPSNACQESMRSPGSMGVDPCPQLELQGGIWRFDARRPGQTLEADGHRFGTGIRNAMALDWNPDAGALFALQHGRDSLFDLWGDLYTTEQSAEIPAEEMMRVGDGSDFGWPYCYFDPFQDRKVLAPEYGGDGVAVGRCADIDPTLMVFPAHWAPNDLLFYRAGSFPSRYTGGAFIAFHGSWNRAPLEQAGYNVVFVPFLDGEPSGDYEVFASGFPGVETVSSPGDALHRPTGLAQGPDGSLYVADDRGGRIWRVRAGTLE